MERLLTVKMTGQSLCWVLLVFLIYENGSQPFSNKKELNFGGISPRDSGDRAEKARRGRKARREESCGVREARGRRRWGASPRRDDLGRSEQPRVSCKLNFTRLTQCVNTQPMTESRTRISLTLWLL